MREDVQPSDAKTGAAAGFLVLCRKDPSAFMRDFVKAVLPTKKEEEEDRRNEDDAAHVTKLITELQKFRANYVHPSAVAGTPKSPEVESGARSAATTA